MRDELSLLPTLSAVTTNVDNEQVPTVARSTLRQCDLCNLAQVCPRYESSATCGYEIPVQLRSKTEISSMMSALLEIQASRALMAKFQEDLLSQGPTKEASDELERFFKLLESMRRITEDRQTLSITASTSTGPGVLTSLFGAHVGEAARALPEPIDSDDLIDDADLVN